MQYAIPAYLTCSAVCNVQQLQLAACSSAKYGPRVINFDARGVHTPQINIFPKVKADLVKPQVRVQAVCDVCNNNKK